MRINVESDLFTDQRFLDMVIELKSVELAIGALVRCWMIAQKFWKSSDNGIPKVEWSKQKLNDALVSHGLAEYRGDFVFVIGSEKHFAWLRERSESGKIGGLKSQENRRSTAKAKPSKLKQTQPSLSSSLSLSLSSSSSPSLFSKGEVADAPRPAEGIRSPIGFFISNYVTAYQKRYGEDARPSLAGKVQGQIKRFLADTPTERACEMIRTYCEMNDAWFITKAHDFGTFIENLSKVGLKLDTGTQVTRKEAAQAEHKQSVANVFANVLGGK